MKSITTVQQLTEINFRGTPTCRRESYKILTTGETISSFMTNFFVIQVETTKENSYFSFTEIFNMS